MFFGINRQFFNLPKTPTFSDVVLPVSDQEILFIITHPFIIARY